ncbi:MAG: Rieske 2Fe-2S domain-containing protein [Candidatus Nitrosopolaris sp.]
MGARKTRVFVGKTSDIPEGKMTHVMLDKEKDILIANIAGNYYATNNICTHEGAKLRDGEEVTCPWHGAKWDVTTGKMIQFPGKLKALVSFKVSLENGNVYVEK